MSTSLQHTILVDHIITTSVSVSFSFSVLYKFHSYIKKWTSSSISLWVKNTKNLQATIFITLLQRERELSQREREGEMGANFVYVFVFLLTLLLYVLLRKNKKESQQIAKLPPGSMGWPYIGETLQLYSQDPNVFFAEKQKRYFFVFIHIES